jgi:hypothetical protein
MDERGEQDLDPQIQTDAMEKTKLANSDGGRTIVQLLVLTSNKTRRLFILFCLFLLFGLKKKNIKSLLISHAC